MVNNILSINSIKSVTQWTRWSVFAFQDTVYVYSMSLQVFGTYPWLNLFFCGKNYPFQPSPFLSPISLPPCPLSIVLFCLTLAVCNRVLCIRTVFAVHVFGFGYGDGLLGRYRCLLALFLLFFLFRFTVCKVVFVELHAVIYLCNWVFFSVCFLCFYRENSCDCCCCCCF